MVRKGSSRILEKAEHKFGAILLPVLILICLTVGIGTVTEIGAVSCVLAAFISMVIYKELDWKGLWNCIKATARQVAVVFAMLAAATVFIWIIGSLNFQNSLAAWIGSLGLSRFAVFTIAMLIIFILGMVLETLVITMIFIPVLAIPCIGAGVDSYVFAVAAAMVCAMGLNTPPVGTLLYLTACGHVCHEGCKGKHSFHCLRCHCGCPSRSFPVDHSVVPESSIVNGGSDEKRYTLPSGRF